MSIRSTPSTPHLDDVDLVRFIDLEGAPEERHRWDDHLRTCGACRADADEMRAQSDAVRRWLAAADFDTQTHGGTDADPASTPVGKVSPRRLPHSGEPAGRSPWRAGARSPWLRAAILVLLLAAPLAAFPGVREWVADRVTGAPSPPSAPHAAAAPDEVASSPRIRFVPAPGTFALALDAFQAGGTLSVGRVPAGDEAVLDVAGPGPLPNPVISERGVRIGNTAATTASYSLRLPREVDAVSVTIGGSVVQLDAPALDRGTVIPLARPPDGP